VVIQFHQNVTGIRRGERVTVTTWNECGVSVTRQKGETVSFQFDMAALFQGYESRKIALTAGDRVRITQNRFITDKRRLNNGDLKGELAELVNESAGIPSPTRTRPKETGVSGRFFEMGWQPGIFLK
jgi:phage terminase Nu1 subunit (DNA packaging protein)